MSTAEHPISAEELMSYLDGELRADRLPVARDHLARCADCQELASDLRLSAEMSSWQVDEPPATLRAPVGVAAPVRAVRGGMFGRRFLLVAAPAMLALVAVVWLARTNGISPAFRDRAVPLDSLETASRSAAPAPPAVDIGPPNDKLQVSGGVSASPKIIRTARLAIVAKDFDAVRPAIDRILHDVVGLVGQITTSAPSDANRALRATLRIPAARLEESLSNLRGLGRVLTETQGGDDVTEQVQDIEARLANHRNTEKRLNEILKNRTGRVSDVLNVEREIARVRQLIEQLDAERANLEGRVSYATITLEVSEERGPTLALGHVSMWGEARNALVTGLNNALESATAAALWALRAGPPLLLWATILWWPWRRVHAALRGWLTRSA